MSNLVENQTSTFRDVLNSKGTKEVHHHMAFASGYVYLSGLRELTPVLEKVAAARRAGATDSLRILMGRSTDKETKTWVAMNKAERRNAAEEEAVAVARELEDSSAFSPESEEDEARSFLDLLHELMTPRASGVSGLEIRVIPDAVLHAKAYLFSDEKPVEGDGLRSDYDGSGYALAGSANLTAQGLVRNLELGLGSSNTPDLKAMAVWFEKLWIQALPVNASVLEEARQHWPLNQPSLEDLFLRMQYLLVESELDTLPAEQLKDEPVMANFQLESISEARQRLEQYGGVMLAHVVGLGKTYMGAKLMKTIARRHGLRQMLVFCPVSVRADWEAALRRFHVFQEPGAVKRRVISVDMLGTHATQRDLEATQEAGEPLDDTLFEDRGNWEGSLLASAELILVDESHRLRNPGAKLYQNLQRAIEHMQGRAKPLSPQAPGGGGVIFCTATPIAKEVEDLFRQMELFWKEKWIPGSEVEWDEALEIIKTPEKPKSVAEPVPAIPVVQGLFEAQARPVAYQPRLQEQEEDLENARVVEAVRNAFLVRRTRGNVARKDPVTQRSFVALGEDQRLYFPERKLKTLRVGFFSEDGRMYERLLERLGQRGADPESGVSLTFVAYDMLQCLHRLPDGSLDEDRLIRLGASEDDLEWYRSRNLGQRLRGAMRSLLFKRLDSSPYALHQTLSRMRERVRFMIEASHSEEIPLPTAKELKDFLQAEWGDGEFTGFSNLKPATHFNIPQLQAHLEADLKLIRAMIEDVESFHPDDPTVGAEWDPKVRALLGVLNGDAKGLPRGSFKDLEEKLAKPPLGQAKVLIFTQYADTVSYLAKILEAHLKPERARHFLALTQEVDLVSAKGRFSPSTMPEPWDEQRVRTAGGAVDILLATDKLSEGCNLQEAHVVINYDLPWAPHTLIQRVGRVDRLRSENERILQINFLVDEHIEEQLSLEALVHRRMEQIHRHIGEDSKVVREDETLNDRALKQILLEDADGLDVADPDDHEYSRPNMVKRLRSLRSDDPEWFNRIQTMRANQRAAWVSPYPNSIPGAVMTHQRSGYGPQHPPRLMLSPKDHPNLLESEALAAIAPLPGAPKVKWDAEHWREIAAQLTAPASLPETAGRPRKKTKHPLWVKWFDLTARAADQGVLGPEFEELLRDRLHRWADLRKDEAEKYPLPVLKVKSFQVHDAQAWHQTWDLWLARFETMSKGAREKAVAASGPAMHEMRMGVALVPVQNQTIS